MPNDDEEIIGEQTISVREGEISRLYVVMCYQCHHTYTASVPALGVMELDITRAGWERVAGKWHCPECC